MCIYICIYMYIYIYIQFNSIQLGSPLSPEMRSTDPVIPPANESDVNISPNLEIFWIIKL